MASLRAWFSPIIVSAAVLLASASVNAQPTPIPNVNVIRDGAWINVVFAILQQKTYEYPDKVQAHVLEAGGLLTDKPVSLVILLPMDWEEQRPKGTPFSFWWGVVALERSGAASDNLVQALAMLYDANPTPSRAKDKVGFKVVSFADKPTISSRKVELKVFNEGDRTDDYAEFFLNFDFGAKTLTLAEKDPEYRGAIIRALSTKP